MRRRALGRIRPLSSLAAALAVLASFLTAAGVTGLFPSASAQVTAAPAAIRAAVAQVAPDAVARAASNLAQAALARDEEAVQGAAEAAAAIRLTYTVRPGDTLSGVAAARCGTARDWTGIYAASRARGWTAWNASDLTAGQHLFLDCSYVPSMLGRASPPPAPHLAAAWSPPVQAAAGDPAASYSGTYQGSGSMQQCIIARESGGQSQVMNSSGHYGLYQFSASTWAESGGNPADFGHASVAEQNQVFYNAVAARGYSDWTPYDGC